MTSFDPAGAAQVASNLPTAVQLDRQLALALSATDHALAACARRKLRDLREHRRSASDLCVLEAALVAGVPALATLGSEKPPDGCCRASCVSLEIARCFHRGELIAAIDLAERELWFSEGAHGCAGLNYALVALALWDRAAEARVLIARLKDRFVEAAPQKYQMLLRAEAEVAALCQNFVASRQILEDVQLLCERFGWALERDFAEPALALALARSGDFAEARAICARWSAGHSPIPGPLEALREQARMQIALAQGATERALVHAERAALHVDRVGSVPARCEIAFVRALAADRDAFPGAVAALRELADRYQIPLYRRRLALLEQRVPSGVAPSQLSVSLRTRGGCEQRRLFEVFLPRPADLAAEVYFDRVQGLVYVGGEGPYLCREQLVFRILGALVASADFALPNAELFAQVWGVPFESLAHEGKYHVAIHRLRAWLDAHGLGSRRSMVGVQDGAIRLSAASDIRVLEFGSLCQEEVAEVSLYERLCAVLASGQALSPRELEVRLGISRSTLAQELRRGIAAGNVRRLGRGPATRYGLR